MKTSLTLKIYDNYCNAVCNNIYMSEVSINTLEFQNVHKAICYWT